MEQAALRADQMSKRFWLLDLKFEQFVTPRLVGVMWSLYLLIAILSFAAFVVYALWAFPVIQAALAIALNLILTIFAMMLVRVVLEIFLVAFRAVERLKPLQNLAYLQQIAESRGPKV